MQAPDTATRRLGPVVTAIPGPIWASALRAIAVGPGVDVMVGNAFLFSACFRPPLFMREWGRPAPGA